MTSRIACRSRPAPEGGRRIADPDSLTTRDLLRKTGIHFFAYLAQGQNPIGLLTPVTASVKGFGRRPLAGQWCVVRGRRSKASQGGNRGQEGAPVWSGATYGDFRIADGSGVWPRGPVARNLGGGNDDDDRVRSRGCGRLVQAWHSAEDWRRREDIAFLLRRAVGDEGKRRCEAGGAATIIMRCRS